MENTRALRALRKMLETKQGKLLTRKILSGKSNLFERSVFCKASLHDDKHAFKCVK